jgi:hypothetical protein
MERPYQQAPARVPGHKGHDPDRQAVTRCDAGQDEDRAEHGGTEEEATEIANPWNVSPLPEG